MKRSVWVLIAIGMALSVGIKTRAATPELPGFLPEYYAPAFVVDGVGLNLLTHSSTNGVEQWQYGAEEAAIWLLVEWINCDSSQAKSVFNNILGYLDVQAKEHGGRFGVVEENDACADLSP